SSGLTKYPEGSGVAQTAAANPPVEPSVAKEGPDPNSNGKEELSAAQIEPSESHLDGAVRESTPGPAETSVEQVEAGLEPTVVSIKPPYIESSEAKSEEILLPSSVEEEEVLKDNIEPKWFESTVVLTSEQEATEEDEVLPAPSIGPPEELSTVGKAEDVLLDHVVKPEARESMGAVPEAMPLASAAPSVEMASSLVTQTNKKLDSPEKTLVSDVKTEHEMVSNVKTKHEMPITEITENKPVLKTEATAEKTLDTAGAETEVKPEEPGLQCGRATEENPEKLSVKSGAETEMKLEKSMTNIGAVMENAGNAINENNEGRLIEVHQNKGMGEPKSDEICKAVPLVSALSVKESPSVDKMVLKAVVCLPDISKSRPLAQRNDPSMGKGGEQKTPLKPGTRGQAAVEKRMALKEEDHPRGGSGRSSLGDGKCKASRSSGVDGKGGGGRNSSQQEKESRTESRASSKQSQEGESRSSNTKRDTTSNKASIDGSAKASKGGTSSGAKQKEEEELFPFKLDEFVTVDEVVEDFEAPVKTRRNPPRGKRKPNSSSEPSSKRRKGKSSIARITESDLSFVTLDEIGEEEDMAAQLMGVADLEALGDPQGLVVVDEVMEEEELLEAVKDPQSLVTLDEICEQEDLSSHKDVPSSVFEEQDLKAEPLVTVDEIGEVEELPLNEPTDLIEDVLTQKEDDKVATEDPGDGASSQVIDDPSALVTVDEIQEDNEENPLEALDEANEDDFLADFNRLKEELNFVTVDEVGEEDEEEENTSLEKNVNEEEDDEDIVAVAGPEEEEIATVAGPEEEDIVAVAGPEEMEILGEISPEEEIIAISKPKGEEPLVVSGGEGKKIRCLWSMPRAKGTLQQMEESGKPQLFDKVPGRELGKSAEIERERWPEGEQLGSGEEEPESKQKKTTSTDVLKVQSTPKDLDYLVPKAGFFCQICSLFYADEASVKNHCKTPLHQQNMEKFMAKQKDEERDGEERSSR
ncbi:ZN638 protein, partial [Crotophaga sulcirostris]|nr:ZN638 protein [Crotophaga sulcirostris]